jgi:tRNA(adenine34) deaminase
LNENGLNVIPSLKEELMRKALEEAAAAYGEDEVPCGAVATDARGNIIAADHNRCVSLNDPTAHAEILVIRKAALALKNYRLDGLILFSTVEPCPMCLSAIIHARFAGLVYGTPAPKWGAVTSTMRLLDNPHLNHRLSLLEGGLLAGESQELLVNFFNKRRKNETP